MISTPAIARWSPNEIQETWFPTELHRIGKNEEFLQRAIERSPELLALGSRRTGIHGSFVPFLELPLPTPTGRIIYPDITFLTGSGHIVIVEVTLSVNPELRERHVIAQIIDYASSISCLSEGDICNLFGNGTGSEQEWSEIVASLFVNEPITSDLADAMIERMRRGEVNIVIACDRLPPGTASAVAGISAQRALGFTCDIVEIIPFVRSESPDSEIVFAPSPRLATEIVARTAVTVTYDVGQAQPSTKVEVTSANDIKENIEAANRTSRSWTDGEVRAAIREMDSPSLVKLLELCEELSIDGTVSTAGAKSSPCFGYHLATRLPNGKTNKRSVFSCMPDWISVFLYLDTVRRILSNDDYREFNHKLSNMFGLSIDDSTKQPRIALADIITHFDEFTELMSWIKSHSQM